jgi:anti-sigma factor RsiW
MTTCRQTIDLLLEYLDGGLADDVRSKLEAHLGDCTPCEEFLATYKQTPGLCKRALMTRMPAEFAGKLTDFLRREIGAPAKKP